MTVTLQDNGGTANGGVDASASQTFVITCHGGERCAVVREGSGPDRRRGLRPADRDAVGDRDLAGSGRRVEPDGLVHRLQQQRCALLDAASDRGGRHLDVHAAANANGSATVPSSPMTPVATPNTGVDDSAPQTFTITSRRSTTPPTEAAPRLTTPEDTPVTVTLSATDVDGPSPLVFSVATAPAHGTLGPITTPADCLPSGTCTTEVVYTPDQDFSGTDSFAFAFSDGTIGVTPLPKANVSDRRHAVNDAPVATPRTATTIEDAPVTITLAAEGRRQDGALTFSISTPPVHGTVTAPGASACSGDACTVDVTYQPADGFVGGDSFAFTAGDGSLTSDSGDRHPRRHARRQRRRQGVRRTAATPSQVSAGASEMPFASSRLARSSGRRRPSARRRSRTRRSRTRRSRTRRSRTRRSRTRHSRTRRSRDTGLTDFTAADGEVWAALQEIPLSTVPILPGWPSILAGTPLATRVLENVTIADVCSIRPRRRGSPPCRCDRSTSPGRRLGSLAALDAVIGADMLTAIPGTDWCACSPGRRSRALDCRARRPDRAVGRSARGAAGRTRPWRTRR